MAGPAAGSFTEVGRNQGDPVDGPGGAAVGIEQPDPGGDLLRVTEARHRDVRSEALTLDRYAGPVGCRPGPGRRPRQLGPPLLVEVEPGPQDPGPADVREGTAACDRRVESVPARRRATQPGAEVVQLPLRH